MQTSKHLKRAGFPNGYSSYSNNEKKVIYRNVINDCIDLLTKKINRLNKNKNTENIDKLCTLIVNIDCITDDMNSYKEKYMNLVDKDKK